MTVSLRNAIEQERTKIRPIEVIWDILGIDSETTLQQKRFSSSIGHFSKGIGIMSIKVCISFGEEMQNFALKCACGKSMNNFF